MQKKVFKFPKTFLYHCAAKFESPHSDQAGEIQLNLMPITVERLWE
jgi:hypothetical protein